MTSSREAVAGCRRRSRGGGGQGRLLLPLLLLALCACASQPAERIQLAKEQVPMEQLFRTGGDPVLTLVTCGGAFDRSERSYADNIIVWATPVAA